MADRQNSSSCLAVGSPEWQLLLAAARTQLDVYGSVELKRILQQEIDWDVVIQHSLLHGISGLLYLHLSLLSGDAEIPVAVMERFRSIYLRTAASGMQQLAHFRVVAETFSEAGIELITLKGAALTELLYGDPGLRPLSDIDIIIKESDWPAACEILKHMSYTSPTQRLRLLPPKLTRYDVEAHVQLVAPAGTCLEFQFDLFTLGIGMLDMDGVWRRSRDAVIAGARVRTLGPEDQLLHLLVHANRHGCSRLKWLVDITEYLRQEPEIDWDILVSIARREKVFVFVYQTLDHIGRLLGPLQVEAGALERLRPRGYQQLLWKAIWPRQKLDNFNGRHEDSICYYFYKPFSGWNLINFALSGRVRDKMAYQLRWIMPSFDWMARTYDQPKSIRLIRYYPVRLNEWLQKKELERKTGRERII